jgi:hypothetical protein
MKTKVLGIGLLCAVLLITGIACKETGGSTGGGGGGAPPPNGAGMTASEIMENANTAANTEFDTYRFIMTMIMTIMGEEVTMDATGAVDNVNQEMYMNMEMDMGELGDMTSDVYIVDDWMYMTMDMLGMNTGWFKTPLTEDMWEEQDLGGQQFDLLEESVTVELLGIETVSGIECYKVSVNPDMNELWNWAMSQEGMDDMDMGYDVEEMIDDFTLIAWVAKDTFYTVKTYIDMTMTVEGETTSMIMTMTLYAFNNPVYISLPAEAADAVEMSF